jgi:hypothetical protein
MVEKVLSDEIGENSEKLSFEWIASSDAFQ